MVNVLTFLSLTTMKVSSLPLSLKKCQNEKKHKMIVEEGKSYVNYQFS